MSVGDVIRQRRIILDLTQSELGDVMCHTGHCICFWEKGRTNPSVLEVPRLCKALGISPNQLFEWDESEPETDEELLNDIYMLIARRKGAAD